MPSHGRCLALVTDAFGGKGGIAQYNRDFLMALATCELVSVVTVLPRHGPPAYEWAHGLTQLRPRRNQLGYALTALWLACRCRPQVIFCGHLHMAVLAAALARLTNARLIVQLHGIESWRRPSRWRRAVVESADLVLCVSRHTRAAVLGWAAIAPERAVVLPNTVSESFTAGDGAALRAELGLGGKKVLLTVGRLDKREQYKGHDRVIAAMPQLTGDGHHVVYVIVGEGDDRGRIEVLAAAANVRERVLFVGALDAVRLVEAYRMADLFVMPSTGEGFGIAFLEAMACGTPALGLKVAGAIDALADGELGMLVAVAELAAAIAAALERPKRDRRLLSGAVRARFGREAFTARVRALMQPLLVGCS